MLDRFLQVKAFSVAELLVVMSLVGILSLIAVLNLKDLVSPTQSATDQVLSVYKLAKAKSIANLVAYQLIPNGNSQVVASYRKSCDSADAWVDDQRLTFDLPVGATFTTTTWSVCIDSRGFPNNEEFYITDTTGLTKKIEIFLGGGISAS